MADQIRSKARRKPPLSRHPLFPVVLALWCGVILALGGLVLATALALTGRPVWALGLGLGLGLVGVLLGVALARRIAAPIAAMPGAEDMRASKRGVRAARRALTYEEPAQPHHDEAAPPAIDRAPQVLAVAEFGIEGWNDTPADSVSGVRGVPAASASAPAPGSPAERIAQADLESLSPLELLERLALSMERRRRTFGELSRSAAGGDDKASAADKDVRNERYDFLLAMRDALRERSDTVVMDRASKARLQAPAGTDEALRTALSALQKMSGAA